MGLTKGFLSGNGSLRGRPLSPITDRSDHPQVTVRDGVTAHQAIVQQRVGLPIRDTDLTDDRLGPVETSLSDDSTWERIEHPLWQTSVGVSQRKPDGVRHDASRI